MGWLYCEYTKDALVRNITAPTEYANENGTGKCECLKHSVRGNHLWAVMQRTRTKDGVDGVSTESRYIMLFLLAKSDGMWGYKDMDEYCGVYAWDCPLNYLTLAPQHDATKLSAHEKEWNDDWRKKVVEFWQEETRKRNFKKSLQVGMKITLPGYGEPFQIAQLKPHIYAYVGNHPYRISPRMIKHAKIVEEKVEQQLAMA